MSALPTSSVGVNVDRRDADIVSRYMERNPGIELVGRPGRLDRSFTGKAHAFNAGYEAIKDGSI